MCPGENRKEEGAHTKLAVASSIDEGVGNRLKDSGQELGGLDLVDEGNAGHGEVWDGEEGGCDGSTVRCPVAHRKHRTPADLWLGPESFALGLLRVTQMIARQ